MVIIISFLYLVFTTHYCEVLDQMGRQDNIWVCNANSHIHLANMYEVYHIRPALLKSKQYYNNAFRTAVSYDALMSLKQVLIVHGKFSDLN